ncbi:hypothetical protein HZA97_03935 [Candidatus Woesearchaeota archaeon]|nr:hypothetical protein [Candidatus Woesearchaeota archaeon]
MNPIKQTGVIQASPDIINITGNRKAEKFLKTIAYFLWTVIVATSINEHNSFTMLGDPSSESI